MEKMMLILTVICGMELAFNSQQSNQLFLMCFHESRSPLCKWTKTLASLFLSWADWGPYTSLFTQWSHCRGRGMQGWLIEGAVAGREHRDNFFHGGSFYEEVCQAFCTSGNHWRALDTLGYWDLLTQSTLECTLSPTSHQANEDLKLGLTLL